MFLPNTEHCPIYRKTVIYNIGLDYAKIKMLHREELYVLLYKMHARERLHGNAFFCIDGKLETLRHNIAGARLSVRISRIFSNEIGFAKTPHR